MNKQLAKINRYVDGLVASSTFEDTQSMLLCSVDNSIGGDNYDKCVNYAESVCSVENNLCTNFLENVCAKADNKQCLNPLPTNMMDPCESGIS